MALRRLTRAACALAGAAIWLLAPLPAHAGLVQGLGKIVAGVFQLPVAVLAGTASGPPILGTLLGVVNGAIGAVTLLAGGTLEVAAAAIPLARAAAPFVFPFVL